MKFYYLAYPLHIIDGELRVAGKVTKACAVHKPGFVDNEEAAKGNCFVTFTYKEAEQVRERMATPSKWLILEDEI